MSRVRVPSTTLMLDDVSDWLGVFRGAGLLRLFSLRDYVTFARSRDSTETLCPGKGLNRCLSLASRPDGGAGIRPRFWLSYKE
jgi:hypothetical protein